MQSDPYGTIELALKVITGLFVTLTSGLVMWYAKKIYDDWKERGDRVDQLYRGFFGDEDIHTMEGVVDVVETHEQDLEEHEERLEDVEEIARRNRERRKELDRRVEKLQEHAEHRHQDKSK